MSELRIDGGRTTPAELEEVARHWARTLGRWIRGDNDTLVLSLTNSLDHLALLLAAWSLRVRIAQVPPTASSAGFAEALRRTKARLAIVDRHNADRLLHNLRRDGESCETSIDSCSGQRGQLVAYHAGNATAAEAGAFGEAIALDRLDQTLRAQPPAIFFTSGSTSSAKAVVLQWDRILAKGRDVLGYYGERATRALAPVLPLSHVYGLYLTLGALDRGATVVVCRETQTPAAILEALAASEVTGVVCPPLIARFLFGRRAVEPALMRRLELVSLGGAATPTETVNRIRANLPDARLVLSYGLVETYSTVCCVDVTAHPDRASSVGPFRWGALGQLRHPESGDPVAAGERGELCVGGSVCDGYLGDPIATSARFTRDGLLRTGDLAEIADDGYVTLRGRCKDVFNLGGLTADPSEIEEVLAAHHAVVDCGAFADNRTSLEVPLAAIVLAARREHEAVIEDILRHCERQLAPSLVPRKLFVVDAIPRGALGKIERSVLRDRALAEPVDRETD